MDFIDVRDMALADLGPAADPRPQDVAIAVKGISPVYQLDRTSASGRGPIQLISPFNMLMICGNSSIRRPAGTPRPA